MAQKPVHMARESLADGTQEPLVKGGESPWTSLLRRCGRYTQ